MFVHGPQPDLVLTVRVQLGKQHAVAVGVAAVGGGVRDEGEVVPGGGVGVRPAALQSLQYERENDRYYRNAEQRIFCINLCQ